MRRSYLITFVLFMVLVYGYIFWMSPRRQPNLPQEAFQTLGIQLHAERNQPPQTVTSTDAVKIAALVKVLRSGEPTDDHKCADSGELTLQLASGEKRSLGILPGHHAPYYEFRLRATNGRNYEMYRVDRAALLAALADFGITKVDLGAPE
jgi:hypothetical protein